MDQELKSIQPVKDGTCASAAGTLLHNEQRAAGERHDVIQSNPIFIVKIQLAERN